MRRAIKTMGYPSNQPNAELRSIAHGKGDLYGAIVLFEGNRPVGWTACYTFINIEYTSLSVWVNVKDRCKGYGYQLTTLAFRYWWRKYDPDVYSQIRYWWRKKERDAHKRRPNKS